MNEISVIFQPFFSYGVKMIKIDNQEVIFMRNDGTIVDDCHVGIGGTTEDGEICFWEIKDGIRPKLKGKNKYFRVCIQRVFPYVRGGEE